MKAHCIGLVLGAEDDWPRAFEAIAARLGDFEWDVPCVVTECDRGKVFAFEAPRGGTVRTEWRYEFTPCPEGTTLTESFSAPLINVEGSPSNFEGRFEMLDEGIKTTIANIKSASEVQTA